MAKQILRKEAIDEIVRCHNDPIYFIKTYCIVKHPVKGLIPFDLYEYQENAIKAFLAHDRVIINKARQLGFSTVIAAFIVWTTLFHNNKDVLIIANKEEVAINLLKKVKLAFQRLPTWMFLARIKKWNEKEVVFSNGSEIKAIAKSDDAGRSLAVSLVVFDEAAHIDRMDELWRGAGSTTATGGKIIAASTPNGIGNWFHEYFTKAESGENPDWHAFITHWWENPEFAEDLEEDPLVPGGKTSPWFRKTTQGWSRLDIAQELLTSFIESGDNFFSTDTITYYEKMVEEPIEKEGIDRNLWIWKKPTPGYRYLISADSSHGSGEDFSTAHIMELKDMEIVAEYKGKMPPDLFGDFLVELGERYNNAYIVPESQGIGNVTGYRIKNLDYRNLCYFDKDTGRLIDQWTAEFKGIAPGQPMTVKERPYILAKAEEYLRKNYVKSYSKRLVREFQTFITKNQKPQAVRGANDDLIMSLAIGIWVRDMCPEFRGSISAADTLKMFQAAQRNSTTYTASNSREFQVENHKKNIRKMLENQKYPINAHNLWIYKV